MNRRLQVLGLPKVATTEKDSRFGGIERRTIYGQRDPPGPRAAGAQLSQLIGGYAGMDQKRLKSELESIQACISLTCGLHSPSWMAEGKTIG